MANLKLKNFKVGDIVVLKKEVKHFYDMFAGSTGTVVEIDSSSRSGNLTLFVRFHDEDGIDLDWGCHNDVARIVTAHDQGDPQKRKIET